jgi:hypothetical protein
MLLLNMITSCVFSYKMLNSILISSSCDLLCCSINDLLNESVAHILRYIELDESSVVGTTYKHLRQIVMHIDSCSAFQQDTDEVLCNENAGASKYLV